MDGEVLTLQHRLVSHFLDTATEYELIGLPDNLYTVDEIQAQFSFFLFMSKKYILYNVS